jgi:hypothetical protein
VKGRDPFKCRATRRLGTHFMAHPDGRAFAQFLRWPVVSVTLTVFTLCGVLGAVAPPGASATTQSGSTSPPPTPTSLQFGTGDAPPNSGAAGPPAASASAPTSTPYAPPPSFSPSYQRLNAEAAPVAPSSTYYWFDPGCYGPTVDCWATSNTSGLNVHNVVTTTGFVPNGDCSSEPGACYGGAGPSSRSPGDANSMEGTWCNVYETNNPSPPLSTDCQVQTENGLGSENWRLEAGTESNDCPTTAGVCGIHMEPTLMNGWFTVSSDFPFAGFGSSPYLALTGLQSVTNDGSPDGTVSTNSDWHMYLCADFTNYYYGFALEDCAETWRSDNKYAASTASCQGTNWGLAWSTAPKGVTGYQSPYMYGNEKESYGNITGATLDEGFSIDGAELKAALDAIPRSCFVNGFDDNPADYALEFVENGGEGSGVNGNSAAHLYMMNGLGAIYTGY